MSRSRSPARSAAAGGGSPSSEKVVATRNGLRHYTRDWTNSASNVQFAFGTDVALINSNCNLGIVCNVAVPINRTRPARAQTQRRRGYMHHGIYVGRGMVVHYAGLSRFLRSGPVEEVTMSRFSKGRPVRTVQYSESKYSPQEIVRRARSRLGENDYQVLRNNCEHFCNWCISGRSHSTQVESLAASALSALVIAVERAKRLLLVLGNLPATAGRVTSLFARDELA